MAAETQRLLHRRHINPTQQLPYSDGHIPAWARFDVFQALGLSPDPSYDAEDIGAAYRRAASHISPRHRRATRGVVPDFPTFDQLNIARDYLMAAQWEPFYRVRRNWYAHWYGPHQQYGWRSLWNPNAPQGDPAVLQPDPNAPHPRQACSVRMAANYEWYWGNLPPPRQRVPRGTLITDFMTFEDLRAWATSGYIIIGEVRGANGHAYAVEARVDTDREGPGGRLQVCRVKPYVGVGGNELPGPGRSVGRVSFDGTTLVGPFVGMSDVEVRATVVRERTHPYP
ncbi:hypothetical protein MMC13_006292 [Lambiella insularis]|nr:hypothetical protein [Lambiella insularis]